MNLEPLDVQKDRRQRAGYYDRQQYRKPASWKDWAWVVIGLTFIAWTYHLFGGRPM